MSPSELDSVERDESDAKRFARNREAFVPVDDGRGVEAVEDHLASEGGTFEYGVLLWAVGAIVLATPTPTVDNSPVGPHYLAKVLGGGKTDAKETVLRQFELRINAVFAAVIVGVGRCTNVLRE